MTQPLAQPLAPVVPGLIFQAQKELDRQLIEMVPPGKRGLAVTVINNEGAKMGLAAVHRGEWFTLGLSVEAQRRWSTGAKEFSVKIQSVW